MMMMIPPPPPSSPRLCRLTRTRVFLFCVVVIGVGSVRFVHVVAEWMIYSIRMMMRLV